jgi:hypothetical protein
MITTMISENFANWHDESNTVAGLLLGLPFPVEKAPKKEYHGSLRKAGSRSLNSATIL